jgi:hypothetical protein
LFPVGVGVGVYLVAVAAQGDSAQELDFRLPVGLTTQLLLALVGPDHQETPEVSAVEILYFLLLLLMAVVVVDQVTRPQIQQVQMAALAVAAHILMMCLLQPLLLPPVVAAIHQLFLHLKEVMEGQGTQIRPIMGPVAAAGLLPLGLPAHLQRAVTVAMAPHLAFLVRLRPMQAAAAALDKVVEPAATEALVAGERVSQLLTERLAPQILVEVVGAAVSQQHRRLQTKRVAPAALASSF